MGVAEAIVIVGSVAVLALLGWFLLGSRTTGSDLGSSAPAERADFRVRGMSCASCVANVESVLGEMSGVQRVEVSFGAERAAVEFDPGVGEH